jgi:hypothetical protein
MPDENEFALEPALDAPPAPEIHQYMVPSLGESITVLPDFAQNAVNEFTQERLELDALEEDGPASNLPVKVETAVSELAERLGGISAVEALAQVLDNPNADLSQILPSEQTEALVWSALENPATQSVILSDPSVRATISSQLLFGHSIEDVQALLNQYQHGSHSPEQLESEYVAAETRVQDFQRSFFTGDINEIVDSSGVDQTDTEAITDRLLLARCRFLDANHVEFLNVQGLHERGMASTVPEARLHNKWTATVLKELQKLSGKPATRAKSMNTNEPKEERPAKAVDIGDGNGDWLHSFQQDFKKERLARGMLTPRERKEQQRNKQ